MAEKDRYSLSPNPKPLLPQGAKLFIMLLTMLLLGLLTWPVWRWLWAEWWSNDYYSHGLLIAPLSAYLVWRNWPAAKCVGDNYGLLLLASSVALFVYLLNIKALYLAAMFIPMMLAGLIWTFGGLVLVRQFLFPLAFLLLMIPLPIIERITLPLSLWTGHWSGALAHRLGLEVTITGAAVYLRDSQLTIGAQCSGINSILSLFTLTALVAYLTRGPWWGRLALIMLATPLAMLSNILRVANIFFVAEYLGVEAAFRFYHDFSGPIFFGVILILIIPLARLLQCKQLRFELLW